MRRIVLSFIALLFSAANCFAAVALQGCTDDTNGMNCNTGGGGGGCTHFTASTTFSYTGNTLSAGSNLAITVAISYDVNGGATTPSVSSMIWDQAGANQAFTLIKRGSNIGTGATVDLWGIVGATAGSSKTITVNISASAAVFLSACMWTGVNQTSVATAFPNSATCSSCTTQTITSATGDMVLNAGQSAVPLGTPTQTSIYSDSLSGSNINVLSNYASGASPVVIGSSTSTQTLTATDILAAGGGATVPTGELMLMGVGP